MSPQDVRTTTGDGARWVRSDQGIAGRIDPGDLPELLRGGLEVHQGTRVLLYHGGRFAGTLLPGRYDLKGVRKILGRRDEADATAIVIDDGEISVRLTSDNLRSSDGRRVCLRAEVAVRVSDPELFAANQVRDSRRYGVDDLARFLSREAGQRAGEVVADRSADDLYAGRCRGEIEIELLSRWKPACDRCGLVLLRFQVLHFEVPVLAAAEAAEIDDLEIGEGYRRKLRELRGDTAVIGEQAKQERLRLDHELDSRRQVFDQEVAEDDVRLTHDGKRRQMIAEVQLDKIRAMEAIRQSAKDREAERRRRSLVQESELYSAMETDKILAMAMARHPHRAAEIAAAFGAVAGGDASRDQRRLVDRLTDEHDAGDERRETGDERRQAPMRRCSVHQIKYSSEECPLCAQS
ncbi:MAG: SPFH domain-containing protein [Thermoanaerobaculia bacterium]